MATPATPKPLPRTRATLASTRCRPPEPVCDCDPRAARHRGWLRVEVTGKRSWRGGRDSCPRGKRPRAASTGGARRPRPAVLFPWEREGLRPCWRRRQVTWAARVQPARRPCPRCPVPPGGRESLSVPASGAVTREAGARQCAGTRLGARPGAQGVRVLLCSSQGSGARAAPAAATRPRVIGPVRRRRRVPQNHQAQQSPRPGLGRGTAG